MYLVQLEEWERDLILGGIMSYFGHPDEVSDKITRLVEKLTKPKEAEIELEFQVFIQNNGDGSASTLFFNEPIEAENYAERDGERLCDDIFYPNYRH